PGVTVESLPERVHVLAQLPHDEVGPVTPQIAALRCVLRSRQDPERVPREVQQGTRRIQAVLVRITEQEFAKGAQAEVGRLSRISCEPLPLPVQFGLRDSVDKTEELEPAHVGGPKPVRDLKAGLKLRLDRLL